MPAKKPPGRPQAISGSPRSRARTGERSLRSGRSERVGIARPSTHRQQRGARGGASVKDPRADFQPFLALRRVRLGRRAEPTRFEPLNVDIAGWKPTLGISHDFATANFGQRCPSPTRATTSRTGRRSRLRPGSGPSTSSPRIGPAPSHQGSPVRRRASSSASGNTTTSTEQFHYEAVGEPMDAESEHGVCSYSGSKTVTQSPWNDRATSTFRARSRATTHTFRGHSSLIYRARVDASASALRPRSLRSFEISSRSTGPRGR